MTTSTGRILVLGATGHTGDLARVASAVPLITSLSNHSVREALARLAAQV